MVGHETAVCPSTEATSRARRLRLLALALLALSLGLAIGYCFTRAPWWDEGVFADVSINLLHRGHLGSHVLYSYGYRAWPQADRYTYWQFPLYLIALAGWFRLFTPTAESMRIFSVFWGCIYLFAWFLFVRKLGGSASLAWLVCTVVALDYAYLSAASDGRMDMMCAALGQAAIAAFVALKDSSWSRAVFAAACFGAASLFCHPMGALTNAMLVSVVILNSRKYSWTGILKAAIPYLAGAALYGIYILQAPGVYIAQMRAATGYRVSTKLGLLRNIFTDFPSRYLAYYYADLSGAAKLKVLALVFALAGVLALALTPKLRTMPLCRTLLVLACMGYLGVAALDNQLLPVYFIYSMPIMAACAAVWAWYAWQRHGWWRACAALIIIPVLVSVCGFLYKISHNEYANIYEKAIAVIRSELPQNGIVMGGSELAFALGFDDHLIDDRYLGVTSGITPDLYVVNPYYGSSGESWEHAQKKLRQCYHLTYVNEYYRVYARNSAPCTVPR